MSVDSSGRKKYYDLETDILLPHIDKTELRLNNLEKVTNNLLNYLKI
jgi:hypothetical protein